VSDRASSAADVAVSGFGMFAVGYPDAKAWVTGSPDPERTAPSGDLIEPRSRRRASVLTRALADAYREAITGAALDPSTVPSVFGSALGEAGTMIGLLDQMWRESGALSPMRFATSVHNAAAGVVSITAKNRGFTTSLGADYDTPAMAITEAVGLVATRGEPVVVVCGDEAAPANLVPDGHGWALLAVAVALVPVKDAAAGAMRVRGPFRGEPPTLRGAEVDAPLGRNPQIGLLDLVDAVARRHEGVLRLDRGEGGGFCVELAAPS
jgi:hypothetical protein